MVGKSHLNVIICNYVIGAMATRNLFINSEWPIGLFELTCSGNETNIFDCTYDITDGGQNCDQTDDSSVFCMRKFNTT